MSSSSSTTTTVYIIEVNPRSSRTIPYISKVTNVPIIDLATKVMLGAQAARIWAMARASIRRRDYFAVQDAGVLL